MKNRFDLIIFDWDGTLINSIDWIVHCLQQAAEQCDCAIPEPQAAKDVIGLSIKKACKHYFLELTRQTQDQLVACYSQEYLSRQLSREDLFPGVYEMLVQLKRDRLSIGCCYGKNQSRFTRGITGYRNRRAVLYYPLCR